MFSSQTQPLRDLTNIKFEIFIVAFTILPFLMLAYFYSLLPERVPQFLTLTGEVETWAGLCLKSPREEFQCHKGAQNHKLIIRFPVLCGTGTLLVDY
jgi:uncharacterized membrane protein